jgi:phosphatidylethanolamine/phosphatidyl-N-methylethanolamine N-methyltransferase
MTLFDRQRAGRDEDVIGISETAARALSVAAVENDFVAGVYEKLASFYDVVFGRTLHPGRLRAFQRMDIHPDDHILEVGVGTGINVPLYPRACRVTGIDFSESMLERARARVEVEGLRRVRLLQMDAADLKFDDNAFDIVYAPYVISVVPDPVRVAAEMGRVCKPGGRIIFLNHFRSENLLLSRAERLISPFTIHIGFKADLHLKGLLDQANLVPISIEKVNLPRIWSLVTCIKH